MSSDRLFQIIYTLLDKGTVTAVELSQQLGVSTRTIYRDIEALCMAGIPIYTTQGKGGGISILNNYVLEKSLVSEAEQQQIIFALKSLATTSMIDSEKLLGKLGALFKQTDTDWIEVDYSRWGNDHQDKKKFELLKTAVIRKQCLAFSYFSTVGTATDRKVKPRKLIYKGKAWYLQALCMDKDEYRTFKVNRIQSPALLPEYFAELPEPTCTVQEQYAPPQVELSLKFSPAVAYRVYDEFDESCIEKLDNGWFHVTVEYPLDEWVYGWLLSFGISVEVLEPVQMRQVLAERAHKIFEMNSKT